MVSTREKGVTKLEFSDVLTLWMLPYLKLVINLKTFLVRMTQNKLKANSIYHISVFIIESYLSKLTFLQGAPMTVDNILGNIE